MRAKANPWDPSCPSRELIGVLAGKWVLLLMPMLRQGPKRNGELMRCIPGVSQKMLTQTLRELAQYRLVERRDFAEVPPRVEYALTSAGISLAKAITTLDNWVIDHYHDLVETTDRG